MTPQELAKALSTDLLSKPNKKAVFTSFAKALDKEKIGTAELIKILLNYGSYLPAQVKEYKKIMDGKESEIKAARKKILLAEKADIERQLKELDIENAVDKFNKK